MRDFSFRLVACLGVAVLLAGLVVARADSPAPPIPWETPSANGRFLFKMEPAVLNESWDKVLREPYGVAYSVGKKGQLTELWRAEGWYTFGGYLSNDGRYFVRMGPWAMDQEEHTDLAVAFYENGKLLREYLVKDLIKDPDTLEDSEGHYRWAPERQSVPTGVRGDKFHLVMVDKTAYDFDVTTGEIVATTLDEGARSRRDVWAEESAAAKVEGERLFKESAWRGSFEKVFSFRGFDAGLGKTVGVDFSDPEWSAYLKPRDEKLAICEVDAVFPIIGEKIAVTLTPEEITGAISRALAHPTIMSSMDDFGGVKGLTLRIQGDRLHWGTKRLKEYLKTLTGREADDGELRDWATVIARSNRSDEALFYLNAKTGEVVYAERWRVPEVLGMHDAAGKRIAR